MSKMHKMQKRRKGKYKILILVTIVSIAVLISGCAQKSNTTNTTTNVNTTNAKNVKLVVCCGAGLMKPMNEIVSSFENKTGVKVQVIYGGSGEIYGILATRGCDVFIPGAYYYVKLAMEKGYLINDSVENITEHIPVIAVPKGNPAGIKSLKDFAKPGVKVAIGDPRACAIGRVAIKIFKKNGIWNEVKKNVKVEAPTVNQLLLYVATGQVDCSIIWEDLTTWAQAKGKIDTIKIPSNENVIKTIPSAVTIYAKKDGNLKIALAFDKYVDSSTALKIWEKWGFKPVNHTNQSYESSV